MSSHNGDPAGRQAPRVSPDGLARPVDAPSLAPAEGKALNAGSASHWFVPDREERRPPKALKTRVALAVAVLAIVALALAVLLSRL